METVGKLLKDKRLEKGLILDDVAEIIKIRKKYLEAIESGNYGEIPDKVYTKSFLKIYSEFLGLDRVYIVKRYLDEVTQEDPIIAPKTYNQHHLGERNYSGEKTSYNRLFYIFIGLLAIAVLVWGVNWGLDSRKNKSSENKENVVTLTDIKEDTEEETPVAPPVIELPEQEIAPKHSYDKLLIQLKTLDRVWVAVVFDKTRQESYTLSANTTKTIEAIKSISFDIGKAEAVELNINGFDISKLGKSGVISLNITLSPGESIQVVTVSGNKSETQILKE